ncbi:hypothetical protein [Pseudoalteromonas sp. MMG012]|uniref:hypothetical protein n=1 Tax=Pseudoalteromonas sp. MMG012 TaxID=2822686 RepID=UPI001B3A3E81|nr:hypothetical protein [Pseudoalteromonas sp. MMG012]MBQ4852162.1 hypothetical protein [Pseudoalteromonas sp. MMG012]
MEASENTSVQNEILATMNSVAYVSRVTSEEECKASIKQKGLVASNNKKGGFDEAKKWVTMGADPQLEHKSEGQRFVTRYHLGQSIYRWAKDNEYPILDEVDGVFLTTTDQKRDKYEMLTVKSNGSEMKNLGIGSKLLQSFNSTLITKIKPLISQKKKAGKKKK